MLAPRRQVTRFGELLPISEMGQKHRFDRPPVTSGLPQSTDILSACRHVLKVPPITEVAALIRAPKSLTGRP
jgi:hypothetical protein